MLGEASSRHYVTIEKYFSGVFEAKNGNKFGNFFIKMLDSGLVDAKLRGFEGPFFKIFS